MNGRTQIPTSPLTEERNSNPPAYNQTGRGYSLHAHPSPDHVCPLETLTNAQVVLPRLESPHRATWGQQ